MYIKRELTKNIKDAAKEFSVVAILKGWLIEKLYWF